MLTNPPPSNASMPGSAPQPENDPGRAAKRRWSYFGVVLLILLGYLFFVFWTRSQDNKLLMRERAEKAAAAEKEDAEKTVDTLGGTEFKILAFYASPGEIRKGETVNMCYGVSNAKTVTLDPPDANVWPAATRCMDVKPKKTQKYVLTAEDASGNKQTADLTIIVK
jgi:hypothetical protein